MLLQRKECYIGRQDMEPCFLSASMRRNFNGCHPFLISNFEFQWIPLHLGAVQNGSGEDCFRSKVPVFNPTVRSRTTLDTWRGDEVK